MTTTMTHLPASATSSTEVTYTIFVPALNSIKLTDCSAEVISLFLSNRLETSRYSVVGTDGTSTAGDEWLADAQTTHEQRGRATGIEAA